MTRGPLTMKLRGRTEAPQGAEGAQFLSARGANQEALHGPLQRLLEGGEVGAKTRGLIQTICLI